MDCPRVLILSKEEKIKIHPLLNWNLRVCEWVYLDGSTHWLAGWLIQFIRHQRATTDIRATTAVATATAAMFNANHNYYQSISFKFTRPATGSLSPAFSRRSGLRRASWRLNKSILVVAFSSLKNLTSSHVDWRSLKVSKRAGREISASDK